ncbi:Cytochrome c oxidase subunit 3 [Botrimarina colliarenosi]|uniref:Cytochrome c oxidase subunit 3 n=1 Tax=Botrimarina colliarenosi TaxID=2528001 RepID=A0A5C6AKD0_9BACT|nr:cytochrome c oxidase subunit 3 [Botrimarina colliarenosi]TWT99870.1 Cytochrome c oxidase subunit 3 [Botrimarina colliarenosi]
MADAATLDAPETEPHGAGHDHGHDDHGHGHPSLAHHFEDLEQQFQAGKLGMWLFLAQEVLFFSGLFAAYTVYRWHYPEVFVDAHHHLNKTLGAVNTIVLLASSLAIAWGVRAAMRNDRRTILNTHVFTLGCAALFLGVKAIEYTHKWDEGIGAGNFYKFTGGHVSADWYFGDYMPGIAIWSIVIGALVCWGGAIWASNAKVVKGWVTGSIGVCILSFGLGIVLAKCVMPTEAELARAEGHGGPHAASHDAPATGKPMPAPAHGELVQTSMSAETTTDGQTAPAAEGVATTEDAAKADQPPSEVVNPEGANVEIAKAEVVQGEAPGGEPAASETLGQAAPREPRFGAANFFSIYFVMTGVHAVHIIAGIIAITWVVAKAAADEFSAEYFLPVENVGLYWHLVDLVWIYLFPLMYLIH